MSEKLFSILSWNVEHFGREKNKPQRQARLSRIAQAIEIKDPDIMAIYEVEGKEIFSEFTQRFTSYSFFITEGRQSQEILIGTKNNLQTFITQKTEFKASNPFLRPGALVTVVTPQGNYSTLFLHLKSMRDPYGWGLRDFMWEKVRKLKKALNKATDDSKYIVLGDLNTMGMSYSFGDKDVSGPEEVERMKKLVKSSTYNMRLLSKSHPNTYSNGTGSTYPPANLDHVFATKNIDFESQNGADVSVEGWTTSVDPDRWIEDYSDHAYLYFEVKSD